MPERGGWSVSTLRVSVRTLGFSYPNVFGKCNLTDLLLSQDFQDGGERGMAERGGWPASPSGRERTPWLFRFFSSPVLSVFDFGTHPPFACSMCVH